VRRLYRTCLWAALAVALAAGAGACGGGGGSGAGSASRTHGAASQTHATTSPSHGSSTSAVSRAARIAPYGLFGAVFSPLGADGAPLPAATIDGQAAAMARSGVESIRVVFNWAAIEPRAGTFTWQQTDAVVQAAAAHGLSVLPNLIYTPGWASSRPHSATPYLHAPADPQQFARFATAIVERYGTNGSFWRDHPSLRPDPVTEWQIWNEQGFPKFWRSTPWPQTYTALLKAAYLAIHRAEPHATVIAGSLVDSGPQTQWAEMSALYRAGAQPYFDAIAVHPFVVDPRSVSHTVALMTKIVAFVRRVMKAHGDAGKPVLLTEVTWPADVGIVPKGRLLGLETTPAGARARLAAAYAFLSRHGRSLGITQAYWYTWASTFDRDDPAAEVSYDFAGLNRITPQGRFVPMPMLETYAATAKRFEGCAKGENARACR
jgi:exo-beta-1,3-glucanase (GH17 family)